MKKIIRVGIIVCAFALLLCVGVLAAEGDPETSGIYNIQSAANITFTVDGAASSVTISGNSVTDYHEGAVKGSLTYSEAINGSEYMIYVTNTMAAPTKNSLVYINQATATADGVSFPTVYPSSLTSGKTYYIYVVGSRKNFDASKPDATFNYYAPYVPGDVVEPEGINIFDALAVIDHIVGRSPLTGTSLEAADVDNIAGVNIYDALEIINYVVGKPEFLGK